MALFLVVGASIELALDFSTYPGWLCALLRVWLRVPGPIEATQIHGRVDTGWMRATYRRWRGNLSATCQRTEPNTTVQTSIRRALRLANPLQL